MLHGLNTMRSSEKAHAMEPWGLPFLASQSVVSSEVLICIGDSDSEFDLGVSGCILQKSNFQRRCSHGGLLQQATMLVKHAVREVLAGFKKLIAGLGLSALLTVAMTVAWLSLTIAVFLGMGAITIAVLSTAYTVLLESTARVQTLLENKIKAAAGRRGQGQARPQEETREGTAPRKGTARREEWRISVAEGSRQREPCKEEAS